MALNCILLTVADKPYSLSKRQAQCLALTLKGQTAKGIARTLHLSARTVEDYIANLRLKFNCPSKCNLGECLSAQQVFYLLTLLEEDIENKAL